MRKLEEYLTSSVAEAMTFCVEELSSMDYIVMSDSKNFIFAVPRSTRVTPLLYMAHLDTRRESDDVLLGRHGDTLINVNGDKAGCLGADDRAGVFVVLNVARNCKEKPYILFTTGEETGHTGAQAFLNAEHPVLTGYPKEFYEGKLIWEPYVEDIYSVVQFDRKGFNEAAFYGTSQFADELVEIVENLGYVKFTNSRSDSLDIQVAFGVAGVNLSTGFLHEHTPDELLLLPALNFALRTGIYLTALIDERIPLPKNLQQIFHSAPAVTQYPAVMPPNPDKNKIFRGIRMECDICGKKRPVIYIPHAQACVCAKCSTRVGGPSFITKDGIETLRKSLQEERDKSRLNNLKSSVHRCPLCGEAVKLSPLKGGVLLCNSCQTYFLHMKDMICFWSDRDDKRFYFRKYSDPVTIHDAESPVPGIPLDWCHICGHIHHTDEIFSYDGFNACRECDAIRAR